MAAATDILRYLSDHIRDSCIRKQIVANGRHHLRSLHGHQYFDHPDLSFIKGLCGKALRQGYTGENNSSEYKRNYSADRLFIGVL